MGEFIYVDNSNLFLEGRRVAAVKKGLADDIKQAMEHRTMDYEYQIDFGKLYEFLTQGEETERCYLIGSRPPPNDTLWGIAESKGFEVHVEDRNAANKEKKIDTTIATEMLDDAYNENQKKDHTITLVSGDRDYVPPVKKLIKRGYSVDVVFWEHAAKELRDECSKFIPLDPYWEHLSYEKRSPR